MGHPPLSQAGPQSPSMSACPPMPPGPPMGATGAPPMGMYNTQPGLSPVAGGGFQQPAGPQGFPQQPGKKFISADAVCRNVQHQLNNTCHYFCRSS